MQISNWSFDIQVIKTGCENQLLLIWEVWHIWELDELRRDKKKSWYPKLVLTSPKNVFERIGSAFTKAHMRIRTSDSHNNKI